MERELKAFKEECLKECDNILKWWETNTIDEENGGFIGQVDFDMKKHPEADKAIVLYSRILWTYSAAYRLFKKEEYLKLANRAYDYIVEKFIDKQNNGVYWCVDCKGNPKNTRNQIFGLAFVICVLCEYYNATKKEEALDISLKLFDSIEKYSLDKKDNGYLDAFSQTWEVLEDMRLSPTDKNEPKTMNTHLHILLGYTFLYRVHKDEKVQKSLKNLINLFFDKIIDVERGALNLFFDNDWTHKSDFDSYGHDMECSWMLWDAVNVLGDEELIKKAKPIVLKMVDHSLKCAYDKDGGLMSNGKDEKVADTDKGWWAQTETVIALLNAYQLTKDKKYLDDSLLTWDFIKKYIIDHKDGEWNGKVSKDEHKPYTDEVKAGAWKCPYHNSRMCMEVASRVDAILSSLSPLAPDTSKMEYRYLGNSGLRVSVLSYGNWCEYDDDQRTIDCVKTSLEHGVNFFDTAEIYGMGIAETTLGKALKVLNVPREKIVVSTKIFRNGMDPNDTFESRKHIIEGVKLSLKRLQLDYVDVVFCHRYDMHTPLEETCRAMNYVINKGWAFYWGTSEWKADQIERAIKICEKLNLIPPIVEQCQYSMLERKKVDGEYNDLFKFHKLGTTIWSPLKGGILTGKYLKDIPEGTRLASKDKEFMKKIYEKEKDTINPKIQKLKELAETKVGCSLAQLAVAWVIANKDVSTCILGASKASQLDENFKALEIYKKLTPEILTEIETILDNCPEGETDFRNWSQLNVRRNIDLGVNIVKKRF